MTYPAFSQNAIKPMEKIRPEKEKVIEIRGYNLKKGQRNQFHKIVSEEALPLLRKWKLQVIDNGPSPADSETYYLVRAFNSLEDRERQEDSFYGSDEWKNGPREAILSKIENYTTLVIPAGTFIDWSHKITGYSSGSGNKSDLQQLSELNARFIKNFLTQDAKQHNEIIHPDFVCIEGDGNIIPREVYLKNWATDYRKSGYTSFSYQDEFIRIFGNMALVRSKTIFTKLLNGKQVTGYTIYTDTYIKENGRWYCVQVQITPVK